MQLYNILLAAAMGSLVSAEITYTVTESANPTSDETEAYSLIKAAMDAAIQRHTDNGSKASKTLTVEYNTGVSTADGSSSGNIRFGSDRSYMSERTALHEVQLTLKYVAIGSPDKLTPADLTHTWCGPERRF